MEHLVRKSAHEFEQSTGPYFIVGGVWYGGHSSSVQH